MSAKAYIRKQADAKFKLLSSLCQITAKRVRDFINFCAAGFGGGMELIMKRTKGEAIFNVFNISILSVLAFLTIYPFIYVLAASLSEAKYINLGAVWFFPKGFTWDAYLKVLEREGLWTAYANSFFYMIVGTLVNLIVTISGAYPLSKKRLVGRRLFNLLVVFTMWFSAGMIPLYLTFRDYNLLNTRTSIIIGFACSAYCFILLRTYFSAIPEAMEEAAKIDGAGDLYVLFKIFLPLSFPSLATIGLFYAVSRWNGYLWSMILLTDDSKIPLQVVLKKLVVDMSGRMENIGFGREETNYSEETVMYATMVFSIIPMLVLYPFIQKYFVKGVMLGSVKG